MFFCSLRACRVAWGASVGQIYRGTHFLMSQPFRRAVVLLLALFVSTLLVQPHIFAGASTLGDFVWRDANANGSQDDGAGTGIDGVVINLYKDDGDGVYEPGADDGEPDKVARTGDDSATTPIEHGWYDFVGIPGGGSIYWVAIAAANFEAGGALEHYVYTGDIGHNAYNGPQPRLVYLADAVVDYNDADFGFALADLDMRVTAGEAADGEVLSVASGDKVTFTYQVTNKGDVDLAGVKIIDNNGTPDDEMDDVTVCTLSSHLAPAQTETCTRETTINLDKTIVATATGNPVTSSGADLPGAIASATDDAVVALNHVAIGNRVWDDASGSSLHKLNGKMDGDEKGVAGVTVQLYKDNGDKQCDPAVDVRQGGDAVTDANGYYVFLDVPSGSYCVAIPRPSIDSALHKAKSTSGGGSAPDPGDENEAPGNDGLLRGEYFMTEVFTVTPGGQKDISDAGDPEGYSDASAYMTVDFGFIAGDDASAIVLNEMHATVSDYLWSIGFLGIGLAGLGVFVLLRRRAG